MIPPIHDLNLFSTLLDTIVSLGKDILGFFYYAGTVLSQPIIDTIGQLVPDVANFTKFVRDGIETLRPIWGDAFVNLASQIVFGPLGFTLGTYFTIGVLLVLFLKLLKVVWDALPVI